MSRILLAIVILAGLAGAALRLDHIRERSVVHTEMYVPRLPLPADIAVPKPRMGLWTVVTSTLTIDTHPPGYYVVMWFVTRVFGTSTVAMRMPSALFGVACIFLLYWLGSLIGGRAAGAVAAAMLAFNGYHIVWSRTARMYTMLGFLTLLSTILLILLARAPVRRRALEFAYAAVALLGLATHVYFWALLASHMLWLLANWWFGGPAPEKSMPRLLAVQLTIAILASPLLAFAAYQSGNPVAELSGDVPRMARQYTQFVFIIPGWDDTYNTSAAGAAAQEARYAIPLALLSALCAALLILGVGRLRSSGKPLPLQSAGAFTWIWVAAAVVAVAVIVAFTAVAAHPAFPKPTLKYLKPMTALPLVMLGAALLLSRLRTGSAPAALAGEQPLVWMLAIVPFAILSAVSLIRPLLDPRGLLFVAPFLLLTLACGMIAIAERSRVAAVPLFLAVAALHVISVASYRDRLTGPLDFRRFVLQLSPHIQPGDLIFLRSNWDTTPAMYYLAPEHRQLRAADFAAATDAAPGARVWALLFHGESTPAAMAQALAPYRQAGSVDVPLARAVLYCRGLCQ